jgi:hypothetical protein
LSAASRPPSPSRVSASRSKPRFGRASGRSAKSLGGAEDRGERLLASWQHHESVLPVSAILDDLRQHPQSKALIEEGQLTVRLGQLELDGEHDAK